MPSQKIFASVAALALLAAAFLYTQRPAKSAAPAQAAPAEPTHADTRPAPFEPVITVDLAEASRENRIQAEFTSNGRDRLRIHVTNRGSEALHLRAAAGQLFSNDNGTVVLIRDLAIKLAAGATVTEHIATAATASTNKLAVASCTLANGSISKLGPLITYLQAHPEVTPGAAQTAVLALAENLPASSFAKFTPPSLDLPSQFDTSAFKVETSDLIGALAVLREIQIPDAQLAITVDPQVKIEAMIDPLAHAAAMRYYGISGASEWEYWKRELLSGETATRHYALFGIARYFPETALQMLPAWVREARTNAVFRMSAVQALAETQRPEALSVLRQLSFEFGQTELGRAARTAAEFLDNRLNKTTAEAPKPVQFRASTDLPHQAQVARPPAILAAAN
jgi:hypothetical protein